MKTTFFWGLIFTVSISSIGIVHGQNNIIDAELSRKVGFDHLGNREFDKAIHHFNKAIELNPKNAEAFFNRGAAYIGKKKLDLALKDHNEALELIPGYSKSLIKGGWTLEKFKSAIYSNRGFIFKKSKQDFKSALKDYNRAIELDSESSANYVNRGILYISAFKDKESACLDFYKACKLGNCKLIRKAKRKGDCN